MNLIPWRNKELEDEGLGRRELARFEPFRFRSQIDRLFDRFLSGDWDWERDFGLGAWGPAVDVTEDEKEVTVRAEIPGVDAKDLDVSVTANTLTISGEKKQENEQKGKGYYHSERRTGSFRRTLTLPPYVLADQAQAEYRNGVLTIRLKKDESAVGKRVPVKASQ